MTESVVEDAALAWREAPAQRVRDPKDPFRIVIARALVATVRKNVTIDWTIRDNVGAQRRVYVQWILRKYGDLPDKREKATETVLEQAEVPSDTWALA